MPNIKSAIKRTKTNKKMSEINNFHKATMKTAIKKVEKLPIETNQEEKTKVLNNAIKRIDTALSKGLVHKNYAARQKSRLTKLVNKMQ